MTPRRLALAIAAVFALATACADVDPPGSNPLGGGFSPTSSSGKGATSPPPGTKFSFPGSNAIGGAQVSVVQPATEYQVQAGWSGISTKVQLIAVLTRDGHQTRRVLPTPSGSINQPVPAGHLHLTITPMSGPQDKSGWKIWCKIVNNQTHQPATQDPPPGVEPGGDGVNCGTK